MSWARQSNFTPGFLKRYLAAPGERLILMFKGAPLRVLPSRSDPAYFSFVESIQADQCLLVRLNYAIRREVDSALISKDAIDLRADFKIEVTAIDDEQSLKSIAAYSVDWEEMVAQTATSILRDELRHVNFDEVLALTPHLARKCESLLAQVCLTKRTPFSIAKFDMIHLGSKNSSIEPREREQFLQKRAQEAIEAQRRMESAQTDFEFEQSRKRKSFERAESDADHSAAQQQKMLESQNYLRVAAERAELIKRLGPAALEPDDYKAIELAKIQFNADIANQKSQVILQTLKSMNSRDAARFEGMMVAFGQVHGMNLKMSFNDDTDASAEDQKAESTAAASTPNFTDEEVRLLKQRLLEPESGKRKPEDSDKE